MLNVSYEPSIPLFLGMISAIWYLYAVGWTYHKYSPMLWGMSYYMNMSECLITSFALFTCTCNYTHQSRIPLPR